MSRADTAPNRRRGGDIRVLLSPASVGSAAGFLGTLTLQPGEVVTEHWHPYSEEFLYCASGEVVATLDRDELVAVQAPQAFAAPALRRAHAAAGEAPDDAGLVEAGGGRVVVVPGDPANTKITLRTDLG